MAGYIGSNITHLVYQSIPLYFLLLLLLLALIRMYSNLKDAYIISLSEVMLRITIDGREKEQQGGTMKMFYHILRKLKLTVMGVMTIEVTMVHLMLQDTRDWVNLIKHGSKLVNKPVSFDSTLI